MHLLFPSKSELLAVLENLKQPEFHIIKSSIDGKSVWADEASDLVLSIVGVGAKSTEEGMHRLFRSKPSLNVHQSRIIVLMGCCGALNEKLQVGNWVQSQKIVAIDFEEIDSQVVEALPEVKKVKMLSLDEAVDNQVTKELLFSKYRCDVVAWESFAAARFYETYLKSDQVSFVEVRWISDLSDQKFSLDDFKKRVKATCFNPQKIIVQLLKEEFKIKTRTQNRGSS